MVNVINPIKKEQGGNKKVDKAEKNENIDPGHIS